MSQYKYEKEAIKRFGKNFIRTSKEGELVFPCPKCGLHKEEKLYVSTKTGMFHCFRCDYKGRLESTPKLSDVINGDTLTIEKKKATDKNVYLMPFHREKLTDEQLTALYNRGITDSDIKFYNITGGKRIQIPNLVIGNLSDLICMWEWRKDKISKTNPKYLYTEDVKKSRVLFNSHNLKQKESVILCEGIFNAITAGKNGVASYGKNLSDYQLNLLLEKQPKSITIAYDPDLPGVTGSVKVIDALKKVKYVGDVYYILLPENKDVNDLGKENFIDYLQCNRVKINFDVSYSSKIPLLLFNNRI